MSLRLILWALTAFIVGYALVTYMRVPEFVPEWPEVAGA